MMREQLVPAFMAALMGEGVRPEQIERAVARVRDLPLGSNLLATAGSRHDEPLVRAFVFEQAGRLERT